MYVLVILESSIVGLLSFLHFYWAFGGKWGFKNALPTNDNGKKVLNPRKFDSVLVALILLSISFYYLNKIYEFLELPFWIQDYAGWFTTLVFLTRAIGDFNYVGFFKKVRQTKFGKLDSHFYSPLCLSLGLIALLVEVVNWEIIRQNFR